MSANNRNRWTKETLDLLWKMGCNRSPWPKVAEATGHPKHSCQVRFSELKRQNLESDGIILSDNDLKPRRGRPRKNACAVAPLPAAAPAEPSPRSMRLAILAEDAELRRRIAVLGPNGLLGDPEPGRSALDQKRAGISP